MKAREIIIQLLKWLPMDTDRFTEQFKITSLTSADKTVTLTTETPINRQPGDLIYILNTFNKIQIASLEIVNQKQVRAITAQPHDLTEGFNLQVTISGADPVEYNGVHPLVLVESQTSFIFELINPQPVVSTGFLLENRPYGFNGAKIIETINGNQITFMDEYIGGLTPSADGAILRHSARISGAATLEKATESYTEQQDGKYWAYVVLGSSTVSKNQNIQNDAVDSITQGAAVNQQIYQIYNIYVFAPATQSISSRSIRDSMEDIALNLYRTMIRSQLKSDLTGLRNNYTSSLVSHDIEAYNNAYYVHRFTFSINDDITIHNTFVAPSVKLNELNTIYFKPEPISTEVIMTSQAIFDDNEQD